MGTAAQPTRENRTITIDFQHEATYFQLLGDGKAFLEYVLAFVMSLGFQLKHKTTCHGSRCLTRHSHYVRVRLGGLTIWRLQCTACRAVFTMLPHFVLRYRQMRPEVARNALLATHGGLSLELCAVIYGSSGSFVETILEKGDDSPLEFCEAGEPWNPVRESASRP
jgi:hypothetical protein